MARASGVTFNTEILQLLALPFCHVRNAVGVELSDELKNQLRKLGLRVRPRTNEKSSQPGPGRIAFDDRGNAVYEWNNGALTEDGEHAERARNKALQHHGLSLVDDEPAKDAPIKQNVKGLRLGYNPYESGMLSKKAHRKRTDLRELSKWVATKRSLKNRSDD